MSISLPALIAANQQRWDTAKFSPHALGLAEHVAIRLCDPKAKAIYKQLQTLTGVPWECIAVIHEREASQSWLCNIAQGDHWNVKSTHVPKGRGPFKSFVDAAVDALSKCAPYAARWKDWSPGGMLTLLELYNGEGYENNHHMASPYLWAGSDQYKRGKYVSDGKFDPNAVDTQLGCALMLRAMIAHDPEADFDHVAPVGIADVPPPVHPDDNNGLNPDEYPDRASPPDTSFVDAPPAANGSDDLPSPKTGDVVDADDVPSTGIKLVKDAVGAKIGPKTVAVGTSAAGSAVAVADDSWFDWIGREMHTPRFWVVTAIVVAGLAYIVYLWVQDHKANQ